MRNKYILPIIFIVAVSLFSCSSSEKRYTGPHTIKQPVETAVNDEENIDETSEDDISNRIVAGTVSQVSYGKSEITVSQKKSIELGSVVYVIIEGKEVLMTVVFPMMTSFRCIVVPNQQQYLRKIKKGMTVYLKQ